MSYRDRIAQRENAKMYRERNRDKIMARLLKWQKENPEKVSAYKEKWRLGNMDKVRAASKRRYANDPEKYIATVRRYQKRHPKRVAAQKRRYQVNNREAVMRAQNKWQASKMSDLQFRIKKILRGRTGSAIKAINGAKKCAKTIEMLGCSIENFRIYLESKFNVGMSWDNYGKIWEIDHIMPCAIFDLIKPEHQRRCFHFSNMQPLFTVDNRRKNRWHVPDQYNLL